MFSFHSCNDLFREKQEHFKEQLTTLNQAVLYINDSCYKYVKSKQIRTQWKYWCCSQEVHSSLSHHKMLFLLKNYHCEIQNRFRCLNWRKKGEGAREFQMLSKFSLVFISTTASLKVVNHASTVNVSSCRNSQFELPPNVISQIDRGSIALSLEYYFSNGSHVPGSDFNR